MDSKDGWKPIKNAPLGFEILCAWHERGAWHYQIDECRIGGEWSWDEQDNAYWCYLPDPPEVKP